MKFFKKSARPSNKERAVAEQIDKIINEAKSSGNNEILGIVAQKGVVTNLDGLNELLEELQGKLNNKSEKSIEKKEESIEPNKNIQETETNEETMSEETTEQEAPLEFEEEVKFEDTPDLETESQLQQPVIERDDVLEDYRKQQEEGHSEENVFGNEGASNQEDEYTEPRDTGESYGSGAHDHHDDPEDKSEADYKGNLKDMPSGIKKKAINKTARMISRAYAHWIPLGVRWVAKVPEKKLQRMQWSDEIDVNVKLDMPDGTEPTIAEYIYTYNEEIDKNIVITEEQREEFEDALKDVLEEKQVAMTPTQRLVACMFEQTATLVMIGIQNRHIMMKNLNFWKEVHEEKKREKESRRNPPKPKPPSEAGQNSTNQNSKPETKKEDDEILAETEEIIIEPEKAEKQ